jgi:hypothetical protein
VDDDNFDLELDEILKEYNELSGAGGGQDIQTSTQKDGIAESDPVADTENIISDHFDEYITAESEPVVENSKLLRVTELSSFVQELSDELEILLFYHRKCYVRLV